jgi:hypothetical protein
MRILLVWRVVSRHFLCAATKIRSRETVIGDGLLADVVINVIRDPKEWEAAGVEGRSQVLCEASGRTSQGRGPGGFMACLTIIK